MDSTKKFKVGDGVIVTADDSSKGDHGQVIQVLTHPRFDYQVRLSSSIGEYNWSYTADELELYTADQQRQPADADLTPDEVLTLQDMATSVGGRNYLGRYSRYLPDYQKLVTLGFAEEVVTDKSAYAYEITERGRDYLATLTSAPADVPTAAAEPDALIVSRQILREMLGFIQSEFEPVPLDSNKQWFIKKLAYVINQLDTLQ